MKRLSFLLLVCFTTVCGVFAQKAGDTMYVAVQSVNVKSSTGWFASTRGKLEKGAVVTVQSVQGKKVEIRSGSLTGWVDSSALTSKRITSSTSGTSASAQEIALAGKGFSEEIEGTYKADNKDLTAAYAAVDAVEKITIADNILLQFITNGKLNGAEGD